MFSSLPRWFRRCVRRVRHYLNMWVVMCDPRIVGPPLRAYRAFERHRAATNGQGSPKSTLGQRLRALAFVRRWLIKEKMTRHRGQWVVNAFLPPFPGKAYERSFANMLPGERISPFSAFVALTAKCPADCWYCSIKNRRKGAPLSTEQWLDVVAQLQKMGVPLIAFTGGEPLVRDDLPELVRAAHDGGSEVQVFTSGIGMTQAKCNALCDAGLWALGVSLDSCDRETVNRACRTPKAYDSAVAALDMSRRAGLYTFINAVADRKVVESGEYRRLYEFGRRLKLQEVRFLEPIGCGRLAVDGQDCFLSPEQVDELRRFHLEMNRLAWGPKVCAFSQHESPEVFGCIGGTLHMFIDPCGDVCPCDLTPLSFGNVLGEGLEAVWKRMTTSMGSPRRHCFMKNDAERIRSYAEGKEFPLPPETSCAIAQESPAGPLPDYFETVTRHFGYPKRRV